VVAVARVAALALLFLACAPIHFVEKTLTGRSGWPQRFLGWVGWIIGVRVRVEGAPVTGPTLLLANHVSWIDILVLGGATGAAFVSKDNLGSGFIHWLADQNHTLYVKRTHIKGAKDQALSIAKSLEGEQPVALFPEGTVGPGDRLLPFRSTLLEAANYAAQDVAIRPVALDYGTDAAAIAWFEEPAKSNVRRMLERTRPLPITLRLLDPLPHGGDRKQLSAAARVAIAGALGFPPDAPSPIDRDT